MMIFVIQFKVDGATGRHEAANERDSGYQGKE
jgi:hypothetical protein